MGRALSLAAAVSLGALPPAFVTALILAPVLINCSVRAMLPGTFAASLFPALIAAAFVLHRGAWTPWLNVVAGLIAWGGLLAVLVGLVVAMAELAVFAMLIVVPGAIIASIFGVLRLPIFVLTLRYSAAPWHPVLLVAGALVPVAVIAFHETGRTCHFIL